MSLDQNSTTLLQIFMEEADQHLAMGEFVQASEAYGFVINLNPDFALAYLGRGKCYFVLDDEPQNALEEFNKAIAIDPNCAEAYTQRGRCYYHLNQMGRAIQEHSRAIELKPDYGKAYGYRSGCFLALKEFELATRDIEMIRKMEPHNVEEYYLRRGLFFLARRNIDKALAEWKAGLRLKPNSGELLFTRGQIHLQLKNYPEARADLSLAANYNPSLPHCCYFFLGLACLKLENWQAALEAFGKCLHYTPGYKEAYLYRAQLFEKLGLLREAFEEYGHLLKLNLEDYQVYLKRAQLLIELRDWAGVVEECNRGLSVKENQADSYYLRGLAYRKLNEHQLALRDLKRAVELEEDFVNAHLGIASLYLEFGMFKEAIASYNQAIRYGPENAYLYQQRGLAYQYAGQQAQAEKDFEQARRLNPTFKEVAQNNLNSATSSHKWPKV
jgi:tetratricopeptide (TPR) repeat protein